jgi:hypothetical protein
MMADDGHSALERPAAEARSIADLVKLARAGKLRMPRFQRGFRWDQRDVEKLFDSIWQGFPIGSLLLWERPAPESSVSFGSLSVPAEETPSALWVVDGQQRLTALVATLTRHSAPDPTFELYFDLTTRDFVRRGQRRLAPLTWLPLNLLLDTSALLDDLMQRRSDGLDDEAVNRARDLATTIGEYKIPLNVVKTEDEQVLREIFYRMNSSGHRMTASEVFRALHAAIGPGAAGDLQTLFDSVNALGFGALRDDTVLRCVLAVRGGDVYRPFEQEFADGEDPATTFAETERALERVFAFLRQDAAIPHVRALPYNGVLPILARFFALHPEPNPRTRNLLRRWLWRGSMAWGRDVGVLRQAVQDVDVDEQRSIENLLASVREGEPLAIDLNAVQLNKAATKMNISLLSSLSPRDLSSGQLVDVGALLDEDGPGALLELVAPATPHLAGRMLHPAIEATDLVPLVQGASSEALASHAVSDDAAAALLAGEHGDFLSIRAADLEERLNEQRRRLAEPDADDHPALATLAVPDP